MSQGQVDDPLDSTESLAEQCIRAAVIEDFEELFRIALSAADPVVLATYIAGLAAEDREALMRCKGEDQ